jgi:hypothetical protein
MYPNFLMQTLRELDLGYNRIEATGAKELATALRTNTV